MKLTIHSFKNIKSYETFESLYIYFNRLFTQPGASRISTSLCFYVPRENTNRQVTVCRVSCQRSVDPITFNLLGHYA